MTLLLLLFTFSWIPQIHTYVVIIFAEPLSCSVEQLDDGRAIWKTVVLWAKQNDTFLNIKQHHHCWQPKTNQLRKQAPNSTVCDCVHFLLKGSYNWFLSCCHRQSFVELVKSSLLSICQSACSTAPFCLTYAMRMRNCDSNTYNSDTSDTLNRGLSVAFKMKILPFWQQSLFLALKLTSLQLSYFTSTSNPVRYVVSTHTGW